MQQNLDNTYRSGRFTSSRMGDLMSLAKDKKSFGAPALNYITEKGMERRLGRSIEVHTNAKPTSWGTLCEMHVFNTMNTEYRITSTETKVHPDYWFWAGSPDGERFVEGEHTVFDFKCPKTLKSFCQLVDSFAGGVEELIKSGKDGHDYYWQLVSNSVLTKATHAELIVFAPYQKELDAIRLLAEESGDWDFKWIANAMDRELPYLLEGGYYKNVNILRFEVPQVDKDLLEQTIIKANKVLEPTDN